MCGIRRTACFCRRFFLSMIGVIAVDVRCFLLGLLLLSMLMMEWVLLLSMTGVLMTNFSVDGGGNADGGCFHVGLVSSISMMKTVTAFAY